MVITENVPLAPLTTLKVGGPARYFLEAMSVAEVSEAVEFSRSRNLPLFVLGGGSNLVISDAGWPGLVLKIGITGINHRHGHDEVVFEVGAGEDWDKFVGMVVTHNIAGLECLSGIPGSVGATPVQNVGAYGEEVGNTIESVLVLDLRDRQLRELGKEECAFSYRTSIFNTSERGRYIILQVNYLLKHGGEAYIAYADLKKYFAGWNKKPTLADTRDAVKKIRAGKGMLIVPGDDDCRSAGSSRWSGTRTQQPGLWLQLSHQHFQLYRAGKIHHLAGELFVEARRRGARRVCRPQEILCGMEREANLGQRSRRGKKNQSRERHAHYCRRR